MVKVYCDRCGAPLTKLNDIGYYPVKDAADDADIFFTIAVNKKETYPRVNPAHMPVVEEPLRPGVRYNYENPDLCIDCMREINEAVKAVWDGIPYREKEDNHDI